jgi:hypothetical protein
MKLAFRFLLLLIHYAAAAVMVYIIGDVMSQKVNILITLLGGLVVVLLSISLILSTLQFIIHFKNKNTQL